MSRQFRAFSLVEVVVAIGVIAGAMVAVVGLIGSTSRTISDLNEAAPVRRLADEVKRELERVRDTLSTSAGQTRLDRLAALLEGDALRLVADRPGGRLRAESAADGPDGIPRRERFYLVEVRSQAGDLAPTAGNGFLALVVYVRWPYWTPTGPNADDAVLVPPEAAHRAFFNLALTP